MRSARQPPLQFSFGRDPSREQRALLPQQPLASSCALARFNLRPATVAFGRGAAQPAGYACLASHQVGDESGDEEEGAVLPQRNCQRCCLFLCVLALMAGGTGLVLRFLLARDSHPSSPAAKLAAARLGVAPSRRPATAKPLRAVAAPARTTPRVVAVPVLRRSPPPPSPQRLGSEVFLIQRYAPPPWPPVGLSTHPPAARSPPPPPPPSVSSPPNWPSPPSPPMVATATPPDARSVELALQSWTRAEQERAERNASRPPPKPPKRRAKNQTRV